jgi:hypothetical protein
MKRPERHAHANPRRYSFGSTAAIVTSMGIIAGLHAAPIPRVSVLTSLLVIALADNVSDSLSIHMYQESERLEERAASARQSPTSSRGFSWP